MLDFRGNTVVITGAANGIGRVLALEYAKRGTKLALLDKDEKGLFLTKVLLPQETEVEAFVLDLSEPAAITRVFQEIVKRFGSISRLINNAGFGITKSPYDLEVEEWDRVINTNLRGTFLCAREAAKGMKARGEGGAIINIASTRALMSEPDTEAYAATKGGILALTHALAISLGRDRIRVNAISPGWIETGDYAQLRPLDHQQHPSGRVGKPEDVARACLYLSHPENDFVTGTNLVIDGGMTRKMIYEE